MDVDAKLVTDSGHKPTKLSPTQRVDLASITKHPGMEVLIGTILQGHCDQQLNRVHKVPLDDPARTSKIEAICSVAQGMTLTAEILKMEILNNWSELEKQDAKARAEAQNETENKQ